MVTGGTSAASRRRSHREQEEASGRDPSDPVFGCEVGLVYFLESSIGAHIGADLLIADVGPLNSGSVLLGITQHKESAPRS